MLYRDEETRGPVEWEGALIVGGVEVGEEGWRNSKEGEMLDVGVMADMIRYH